MIRPPEGVWRSALLIKLYRTWVSRAASARTGGRPAGVSTLKVTPSDSATGSNAAATSLSQRGQIGRLQVQRELSGLGLGELVQIVDQVAQVAGLVVEVGDLLFAQRVDVVQNRLQAALQDAERRAQLVGHVGHHVAAQGLAAPQGFAHLVEGGRHLDHLGGAGRLDAAVEIARADVAGCFGQAVERGGEAAAHQNAGQDGRRPADDRRQQQEAQQLVQQEAFRRRGGGLVPGPHAQVADRAAVDLDHAGLSPDRRGAILPMPGVGRASYKTRPSASARTMPAW